jgi:hypothetical protein
MSRVNINISKLAGRLLVLLIHTEFHSSLQRQVFNAGCQRLFCPSLTVTVRYSALQAIKECEPRFSNSHSLSISPASAVARISPRVWLMVTCLLVNCVVVYIQVNVTFMETLWTKILTLLLYDSIGSCGQVSTGPDFPFNSFPKRLLTTAVNLLLLPVPRNNRY